jgi:hypothetical protein
MGGECGPKDGGAFVGPLSSEAVVYVVGREETDAAVAVLAVVPGEEVDAVRSCVLRRSEAFREIGTILEGLELRLGERVVVGDVRPRMTAHDTEIGEQESHGFAGHGWAAVGVQSQLERVDAFAVDASGDEVLGNGGRLLGCDDPTYDVAAIDVKNDV